MRAPRKRKLKACPRAKNSPQERSNAVAQGQADAEDWAVATWLRDQMKGRGLAAALDDARVAVERLTRNVMLCNGPVELFSQEKPAYRDLLTEEDFAPIDILYGRYTPEDLKIEIFVDRIRADAPRFGSEFNDLLTIIRIHEYAHAVVDTGINVSDVEEQLANFGAEGTTDWESFLAARHRKFRALDDDSSELLAQAITWACITHESTSLRSQRLIETFLALEKRQPPRYRLPSKIKQIAFLADWGVVLRAAQGELDVWRGPAFKLAAGLMELIWQAAKAKDVRDMRPGDALAAAVTDLQRGLASVDIALQKPAPAQSRMELLVAKKGHIELRMYKEAAHHRPHFHLEYKTEYAASYALDNFERLAGYMRRKHEDTILSFAKANQRQLMELWNSLNGTGRIAMPGDA